MFAKDCAGACKGQWIELQITCYKTVDDVVERLCCHPVTVSIKRNFLWSAAYQVLLIIVPLITIPYVSRVLGAEQVGLYSYTQSISNYFMLLAKLGMDQYGVRLIAQMGNDRTARSRAFWSAWLSQIITAVPVILVYSIYAFSNPVGGTVIALLWGLWILSSALDVTWLFFGVENFKMPMMRNFVTKISGMVVIFLFCKDQGDLWAYILGISLGYFANSVLILPFIKQYVDVVIPKWRDIRQHFLPNLRLFSPVIAISLYMQFNKILLGMLSGMVQAGYYEYADKIARFPLAVVTALCSVMLPHMTAMLSAGKHDEVVEDVGKSLWFVAAVAIGIAFGIASVSAELVPVFLGSDFGPCVLVIPAVAVALPLISSSNVIGNQYMLPMGMDRHYTYSVWAGAVVNVGMCLLLLRSFGAFGAALATIAAEAAVLLVQCWSVRHDLPVLHYLRSVVPFLGMGFVMYGIVRLLSRALVAMLGLGWLALVVEVILAVIVYGVMALVWCWKAGRLNELLSLIGIHKFEKRETF